MMFTVLTLGVLSSIASEVVTWINKKVNGTVLQGDGAFILAAVVALAISAVQVWHAGIPFSNVHALWLSFAQIWVVSQGFFLIVVQKLGLDVQTNQTVG